MAPRKKLAEEHPHRHGRAHAHGHANKGHGGHTHHHVACTHCGGSGLSGGAWYDFLDPHKNGVGDLYNKIKHEVVDHGIDKALESKRKAEMAKLRRGADLTPIVPPKYHPKKERARLLGLSSAHKSSTGGSEYGVDRDGKPAPWKWALDKENAKMAGMSEEEKKKYREDRLEKGRRTHYEQLHRRPYTPLPPGGAEGGDYTRHGAYTRHHRDGRPYRRAAPASKRTLERNAIVKQVMRDKGLSLIEASKHVKAHGLYK